MRILLTLIPLALTAVVTAQDPTPPKVTPPGETKPPVVEPAKKGEVTGKQDPKGSKPGDKGGKQEPGQKPKTGEPAGGEKPPVEEPAPLPQSADPEDLRAMKSAAEMIAAERSLRERIKNGQIKDIEKLLSFEEISSWPYEDGLKGIPKPVKELDGKQVVMIGFMLPIYEVENIKEFLLVQSLWACCYGTPPDINGIVRVVMKGDRRCDYQFDPILVKGTFKVEETTEDGYCIDIFQLHATEVSLLK
ncbi:MAG: DUF3299 domain-containing protein [Planctomycetota bacterium]